MADYYEAHGFNLLTNSSDVDADAIAIRKIGETVGSLAVPVAYPATYNLTTGTITILNDQGDCYITLASDVNNPDDGVTEAAGTIYFTVIDEHGLESTTHATCTVNLTGSTGGSAAYVETGLVERWAADAGITLSGSDITDWLGQEAGLNLDAIGTPTQGTPPGGTASATVVVGPDSGMTGSTLTGLPAGAAARTVQMIWKPTQYTFWSGFGWGASGNNQAFTIAADDATEIGLDYKGNRVTTSLIPPDQWLVVTATYDGTDIEVWIGDALVASATVALATGTSLINLCRSFSGYTTQAEVGEILVYGRVLTAAEIRANVAYLNSRFIGSATVAAPSAATGSALAETSFTANVTVNDAFAVLAWAVSTSATPMSEADILAGTGAADFGVAICNGGGTVAPQVTGLTASTAYYVHTIKYGLTGGKSSVVTSAAITTTAAPVANPVLSSASLTATGTTTLSGSVSTDTGNGTLEYGLMLSAATTPNLTQLEAGTDGDGNPLIGGLRTKAITASGAQPVSFTGATEATAYKVAYGQRNGSGGPSNVVTATATTDAASAGSSLDPDATATTTAGLYAILDAWEADWNGSTPSGKTNSDVRVAQLTAAVAGSMTITNDFSAYPGVIVRGIGPYADNPTYPYYPTCGSHVSGTINITNSRNLTLYGITAGKIVVSGGRDVRLKRVSAHSRWSATRSWPSTSGPGIQFSNSPGGVAQDFHTGGFNTLSFDVGAGCDDMTIDGGYLEQFADDLIKFRIGSSTVSRGTVRRNWAGRDNLSPVGAHSDFLQNQSGNTPDFTFWGNFYLAGAMLNNITLHAFLWQSNTNVGVNTICEQNLYFGRGTETYDNAGSAATCRYNTAIYCEVGNHGDVQPSGMGAPKTLGGWNTLEYNFVTRLNSGSADTSGTGGVCFTIGNVFGSSIVADVSGYATYWEGFPAENAYIDECKPLAGSPAHWDYTGQKVGGWQRSQEIFEQGIHPGNVGWPVAGRFHAEYDPLNTLGSSYTGTYDADGNNVTPAPTSVTITNPALAVYDSDPHGVDAARITFTGTHDRDGATLQIRVYDPSDNSNVVGWTDFTAGAGGAWSKSLDVPRGWNACRAQVRAKGNTAVSAAQTADFYSGYIWGVLGQSEAQRPISTATSSAALTPPAKTLWVKHNSASGSASGDPVEVTNASNLNLRRMACAVAEFSDAPMMIVCLAENGTGLPATVNANETTDRSWFGTVETPVDYIQSRGSDLSVMLWHWPGAADGAVQTEFERWAAPALVKQALNSLNDTPDASGLTAYTGGSVNVVPSRAYTPVRFFWDMNGTGQGLFDASRTKLVFWHGASFFNPQGANGVYAANDIQKGRYCGAQKAAADGTALGQVSLASVAGWTGQTAFGGHLAMPESTHVNDDAGEADGEALVAVYMAIAACRAVGALLPKEPRITAVSDAGTHWDVTIDLPHGGNLSTPLIQHAAGAYAGSFEATNWQTPTALDEGDIATLHEVQGFAVWTGGTASWTGFTATIIDTGTGTAPNRTGKVRVTPTGGTAGKTLSFGVYDGFNMLSVADAKAARVYTHMPVETRPHVSGTGYGYPVVRQQGNTQIVVPW